MHILVAQPSAFTASEFRRADREHERERSPNYFNYNLKLRSPKL